jgi:hypothetical protein
VKIVGDYLGVHGFLFFGFFLVFCFFFCFVFLDEAAKKEVLCHCQSGTKKIPSRALICSPSPAMATSPYVVHEPDRI